LASHVRLASSALPNRHGLILNQSEESWDSHVSFQSDFKVTFPLFLPSSIENKEEEEQTRRQNTGEVESSNRNEFLLRINGH